MHVGRLAGERPIVPEAQGGENSTSGNPGLAVPVRLGSFLVRIHYVLLVPLIILSLPAQALANESLLVMLTFIICGGIGEFLRNRLVIVLTSGSLLITLVWGRIAVDLFGTPASDTAVFLAEFGLILFLMESNLVVLTFQSMRRAIVEKDDAFSRALESRLSRWFGHQLSRQGSIAVGSIGLSIVLLPLAGLTSISTTELPITGGLLLGAIITLLFLVTHRREPERR